MSPADEVLKRLYALRPLGHDTSDYRLRRRLNALRRLGHDHFRCRLRICRSHYDGTRRLVRLEFLKRSFSDVFVADLVRDFGAGTYRLEVYEPTGVAYLDASSGLWVDVDVRGVDEAVSKPNAELMGLFLDARLTGAS